VHFQDPSLLVPNEDVQAVDDPDDPLQPLLDRKCINWTSLGSNKDTSMKEVDDSPDLPSAQMDDGAQATCTNDHTLLHWYTEYDAELPCATRLHPAAKGPGILPVGEGYLRVPAPAPFRFYEFLAYYSPSLNATLLSECDLCKGLKRPKDQYSGVSHQLYYGSGTWTAAAYHKSNTSKDVVFHGIVRCGKKLTHTLIRPALPPEDLLLDWIALRLSFGWSMGRLIQSTMC
jgi:hypothetical protein